MRKIINRTKNVISGEDGASNVEIIVWISVVLIIATTLFLFRGAVVDFLNDAIGEIGKLKAK